MNKQNFIDIVNNPQKLNAEALRNLEELAASFPYCQAAHVLIAKSTSDTGSMTAGIKVKKASAYTSDRKNLKHLLLKKDVENEIQENKAQEGTHGKGPEISAIIHEVVTTQEKSSPEPVQESTSVEKNHQDIHDELQENLKTLKNLRPQIVEDQSWLKPEEENQEPKSIQEENQEPEVVQEETYSTNPEPSESTTREDDILPPSMPDGESFPEIKDEDQELISGYLHYLNNNRKKTRRDPQKINMLIEKFIKEEPAISPLTPEKVNQPKDLAERSVKSGGPVSETFARILERQGKFEKAISVYEQLILKNPEKTAYFASLIEDRKNKIKE